MIETDKEYEKLFKEIKEKQENYTHDFLLPLFELLEDLEIQLQKQPYLENEKAIL